jgi:uncharacterized Ntn-hydrolase superfamily protein
MTFSIIARDAGSGAFGVATATGGPVVGSLVPHAGPGVGAIATQGYTNPLYGFDGLTMLGEGRGADAVVRTLVEGDSGRDKRQLIVIDDEGRTAGWTGKALTPQSGMILEAGVAVAGNLLADTAALHAMLAAYRAAASEPLEGRLLAALLAGEAKGGDARGARSAAIRTYLDQPYPRYDMRIDWADDPIAALRELLAEVDGPDYGDFYDGLPRRTLDPI